MRVSASLRLLGLVLATLISVAFATGTAGRAAPSVSDVQLDAYQLRGGLPGDLCNTTSPDQAKPATCSLCQLLINAYLPTLHLSPADVGHAMVATVVLPQVRRAEARRHNPAAPTRGPPRA